MPTSTFTPSEDGWVRGQSPVSQLLATQANGSFNRDNLGNTAWVSAPGNWYTARTYYRFDTTGISTDAQVSSAFIQSRLQSARGVTSDAMEVHKLWSSTDNSSTFGSALFQTTGSQYANTTTDVGNTADSDHQFTIDGTLLTYLQTQITAGAQPAFLLRNKGDYDVATEGNASGVNTRGFYGTDGSPDPFLSITYTLGTTHNFMGVSNSNLRGIMGIQKSDIDKVNGV